MARRPRTTEPARKGPPPCQPARCKTCIFNPPGRRVELAPDRLGEIQGYLIGGKTHLCHTDEKLACRGGREYQLQVWSRLGILAEPTDEALARAMGNFGL